jgi:hypothetical protein
MNKLKIFLLSACILISAFALSSCQKSANASDKSKAAANLSESDLNAAAYVPSQQWNDYWYAGKAEITSYILMQSRYGEMHEGSVVNIFVTEDFSKSKQVKLDDSVYLPADSIRIESLLSTVHNFINQQASAFSQTQKRFASRHNFKFAQ